MTPLTDRPLITVTSTQIKGDNRLLKPYTKYVLAYAGLPVKTQYKGTKIPTEVSVNPKPNVKDIQTNMKKAGSDEQGLTLNR